MVEHILVLLVASLILSHALIAGRNTITKDIRFVFVLAIFARRVNHRRFAVGTLKRVLRRRLAIAIFHALEVHTIVALVTRGAGVLRLDNPRVLIASILAKPTYGKRARLI
jgi:hypothetical protein